MSKKTTSTILLFIIAATTLIYSLFGLVTVGRHGFTPPEDVMVNLIWLFVSGYAFYHLFLLPKKGE